ncbi:MAG: DNA-binding protein [Planctomycetota bacterium]|nr:MAG: DNA-binding protein [Planctomycetota bacterium]
MSRNSQSRPFLVVSTFSRRIDAHPRIVQKWLRDGRIPGAYLEGGTWLIPSWAKRPAPRRQRRNANVCLG